MFNYKIRAKALLEVSGRSATVRLCIGLRLSHDQISSGSCNLPVDCCAAPPSQCREKYRLTMREPILEPLLRKLRIRRVLPYIREHRNCRLLDVGCGWDARFLKSVGPYIGAGVGVDFKAPELAEGKICTERLTLQDRLPYADGSFDVPLPPEPARLRFSGGLETITQSARRYNAR